MRFMLFIFLLFSSNLLASVDTYRFDSDNQEERFKQLISVLRCPTCQNQNLSDSNSMVADDLKQIVYEKVMSGESDEQIIQFMKQRYGEFILYQPEFNQQNLLLWTAPFLFLCLFFVGFFIWYRRQGVNQND